MWADMLSKWPTWRMFRRIFFSNHLIETRSKCCYYAQLDHNHENRGKMQINALDVTFYSRETIAFLLIFPIIS